MKRAGLLSVLIAVSVTNVVVRGVHPHHNNQARDLMFRKMRAQREKGAAEEEAKQQQQDHEIRSASYKGCDDVLNVTAANVEQLLQEHEQLVLFFIDPSQRRSVRIRPEYCRAAAQLLAEPEPKRLGVADMSRAENEGLLRLFAAENV